MKAPDRVHRVRTLDGQGNYTDKYAIIKVTGNRDFPLTIEATEGESPYLVHRMSDSSKDLM